MALFDRQRLPSRSALSRFLASLTWEATEALRTLFLADLLARPLDTERHTGQLVDRTGNERVVFDLDGTLASRRASCLATDRGIACTTASLDSGVCAWLQGTQARRGRPYAHRRLSLAHSYHWLGSFGNSGNGRYREELRRGLAAIRG